jgi:aspartyl aminopeptidase
VNGLLFIQEGFSKIVKSPNSSNAVCAKIHPKYMNTLTGDNEQLLTSNLVVNKVTNGKEIPLQTLTDPEGSRRFRRPRF